LATATTTTGLRPFAPLGRPGLIYHQCASHQSTTVAALDGLRSDRIVINLDEAESPGFPAETVAKNIHTINMNACFFKEGLQVAFSSLVGQIAYEQLCHYTLLTVVPEPGIWIGRSNEGSHQGENRRLQTDFFFIVP
jgi:hypothetical protein